MKEPHWLLRFSDNAHSQSGEDGIIAKVLAMLPNRNRVCVEFGAWDGVFLSNVRRLIMEENYSSIMIEGDEAKFHELKATYSDNDKVTPLHAFVGFDAETCLDQILSPLSVPVDFDFLSIDIDGNDFHVWNAMDYYRPKLICIEFNPTIPTEVDFVQPAHPKVNQGCSLSALCRLAQENSYELICVTSYNAFFVDAQYFNLFEIADNSPHALRQDISLVTCLFSGYDGSVHLAEAKRFHWHRMDMDHKKLQQIPRFLQSYPHVYSRSQALMFKIYRRLRQYHLL